VYIKLLKQYEELSLGAIYHANDNVVEEVLRGHRILDAGAGSILPVCYVPPVAEAAGKGSKVAAPEVKSKATAVKLKSSRKPPL